MMRWLIALLMVLVTAQGAAAQLIGEGVFRKGGAAAPPLPAGAAAVYSLRCAVSGYSGAAVNVRRSSDNTTQDLPCATVASSGASFAGTGALYVTKWYDQTVGSNCSGSCDLAYVSGNGTAYQPQLSLNGPGGPTIACSGPDGGATAKFIRLTAAGPLTLTGDQTIGGAVSSYALSLGTILSNYNTATPFNGWGLAAANSGNDLAYWSSGNGAFVGDTSNLMLKWPRYVQVTRASGAVTLYVDGTSTSTTTGSNVAPTQVLSACATAADQNGYLGGISELYAYPSALSTANQSALLSSEQAAFPQATNTPIYGNSSLVFGGQSTSTGSTLNAGNNTLQYERTQAWSALATVRIMGASQTQNLQIIFSNVTTGASGYPGYELWIDGNCFLHTRLINNINTGPNYLGVAGSKFLCDGRTHVVGETYDGSSTPAGVQFYVDGVADTGQTTESNTLTASIVSGTQTFMVGNQANFLSFPLRGIMGWFALSNTNRSSTYMQSATATTTPPTVDSSTALQYNFQDATGTAVVDVSGHSLGGSLSATNQWFPQTLTALTASGPSTGTQGSPSTNFTVTLNGASFNGSQTVTITDGGQGGTFTPSVGTCATAGTCTVTPASTATSFTFTYNAAVTGTINLTISNAQGWVNPANSPLAYASTASSGCSQATALLARMDGSENTSAVTTAVCGLVTDGVWSKLDALYVFAINSSGNALLNWISTSFSPATIGHTTCTFTANTGYACDGTAGYIATGFTPSTAGGNYTLNSASLGACDLTTPTSSSQWLLGVTITTSIAGIAPRTTATTYDVNDAATPNNGTAATKGAWATTRTASGTINLYLNGSANVTGQTANSVSLPSQQITLATINRVGGPTSSYSSDTLGYAFIGGGLTGTQVTALYNRLHTYLTTIGAPSGC